MRRREAPSMRSSVKKLQGKWRMNMLLCYRYNEIRNLNKGDSYNIMVLIIAIIALVVGLYSLYIARQSVGQFGDVAASAMRIIGF